MYENCQIAKIIWILHENQILCTLFLNFAMNFSYHRIVKCFYSGTNYCNLIKIQLPNLLSQIALG